MGKVHNSVKKGVIPGGEERGAQYRIPPFFPAIWNSNPTYRKKLSNSPYKIILYDVEKSKKM